jgi:uncharacterized protein involved in exopolysaccharide biosynthesis
MRSEDLRFELVSEPGSEYPPEPPLRLLRRALRGRYRLAALLVALLAALGGAVGYLAVPAKYVSTGLVHIEGALPAILYPTQESQVPPMFDAYVASQVAYLHSGQLLAAAVDLPDMAEAGWPAGPKGVSALHGALTVRRGRGEQTISVSVTHRDPRLAQAAVNAVLEVYGKSKPDPAGLSLPAKERALVRREKHLEEELEALRLRILEISGQYGHVAVEQMHASKVDELLAIDRKLDQIRLARSPDAGAPAGPTGSGLGDARLGAGAPMSPLKEQELALLAEIKSSDYAPDHPVMRELTRQVEAIRIRLDLRQRAQLSQAGKPGESGVDASALAQLDRLEAGYAAMRDRLREEAAALGRQRIALAGLGEQADEIRGRLATTRQRLDEIRFEGGRENADRINIIGGGLPGAPARDRRAGLAGAGALFGAVAGIAIVFLIGVRDRRVRFVDELESMGLPATFISSIPNLAAARTEDPRTAALSVRPLRHWLQQRSDPERNIHAVTSCDRGESKTNIVLALGASFADAGYRTLLVDADFASARLSRELELGGQRGLREGIGAGNASGGVHTTRRVNLWGMPVGSGRGVMPRDLTRVKIRRLYDDLRHRFDAVIVDTGSVLTEIEACLVTAVSDHVAMLVGRNQEGELVRSTAAQLRQLGIENVGMIFSEASESDCRSRDRTASGGEDDAAPPLARLNGDAPEAGSPPPSEWKRAA